MEVNGGMDYSPSSFRSEEEEESPTDFDSDSMSVGNSSVDSDADSDTMIHCAALSDVMKEFDDAYMTSLVNWDGTDRRTPKDAAALCVMQRVMRMDLLKELNLEREGPLVKAMRHIFTRDDWNSILSNTTNLSRAKTFVDLLCARLTSKVFYTFVNALTFNSPLKERVVTAYEKAGGQIMPRYDFYGSRQFHNIVSKWTAVETNK